ncbi:hypothetical protein AVEN_73999-1 [Araneus ventricosus]|uniref:Uncharacterized protein n=1 Tax=Araneus ventricosus TaxID=182803 RepID=A0A4Y2NT53_ARAVE|nr:hypothetical protein AVEN_73999-1 [Araneus ventricosus]
MRTGSGDPEVPELPSARGYILTSELSQSSTFGAPVFDHRSCSLSPSMSDSAHGPDMVLLIFGDHHQQQHYLSKYPFAMHSYVQECNMFMNNPHHFGTIVGECLEEENITHL